MDRIHSNESPLDQILSEARVKLQWITPMQAYRLRGSQVGSLTFLLDIRTQVEKEQEGAIDSAPLIERNLLVWKFDPLCPLRLVIADRYDLRIIIFHQKGCHPRWNGKAKWVGEALIHKQLQMFQYFTIDDRVHHRTWEVIGIEKQYFKNRETGQLMLDA